MGVGTQQHLKRLGFPTPIMDRRFRKHTLFPELKEESVRGLLEVFLVKYDCYFMLSHHICPLGFL